MSEDRGDAAEADEDGGGGSEKLFSAVKPLSASGRNFPVEKRREL